VPHKKISIYLSWIVMLWFGLVWFFPKFPKLWTWPLVWFGTLAEPQTEPQVQVQPGSVQIHWGPNHGMNWTQTIKKSTIQSFYWPKKIFNDHRHDFLCLITQHLILQVLRTMLCLWYLSGILDILILPHLAQFWGKLIPKSAQVWFGSNLFEPGSDKVLLAWTLTGP